MNVASLKLCKELYKLSGWKETDYFYQLQEYEDGSSGYYLINPALESPLHANAYPAYDLGYLMRKFVGNGGVEVRYGDKGCIAISQLWSVAFDTPENAVSSLAISLFNHGILKGEEAIER